jgi:hypothetical protein
MDANLAAAGKMEPMQSAWAFAQYALSPPGPGQTRGASIPVGKFLVCGSRPAQSWLQQPAQARCLLCRPGARVPLPVRY